MSTRSTIARRNTDGSYDEIYCHWDGYPSNQAPLLLNHYNTPERVQELLDLGNLSSLAPEIGEKHDFDKWQSPDGVCNAYGRDRGEKAQWSVRIPNEKKFRAMLAESWTEWVYVFDVTRGAWEFFNNPSPTWFKACGKQQLPAKPLSEWEAEATPC